MLLKEEEGMSDIISQLPTILGLVAVVVVLVLINTMVNKANKQKRLEGKMKAGIIDKDGQPTETEAEKKAKMEEALKKASRHNDKKE